MMASCFFNTIRVYSYLECRPLLEKTSSGLDTRRTMDVLLMEPNAVARKNCCSLCAPNVSLALCLNLIAKHTLGAHWLSAGELAWNAPKRPLHLRPKIPIYAIA
jgi:hypothetical protein